jgi:hypothetical protein
MMGKSTDSLGCVRPILHRHESLRSFCSLSRLRVEPRISAGGPFIKNCARSRSRMTSPIVNVKQNVRTAQRSRDPEIRESHFEPQYAAAFIHHAAINETCSNCRKPSVIVVYGCSAWIRSHLADRTKGCGLLPTNPQARSCNPRPIQGHRPWCFLARLPIGDVFFASCSGQDESHTAIASPSEPSGTGKNRMFGFGSPPVTGCPH